MKRNGHILAVIAYISEGVMKQKRMERIRRKTACWSMGGYTHQHITHRLGRV
jgi:hypothetical protein